MKKKYKIPKLPVVSLVLMVIFLVGGSLLMAIKNTTLLPCGLDWPSIIVCFVFYLLILGGAFYYAFFEKVD